MSDDLHYMQRALALAARGFPSTAPNPMVGCVLVQDGRILAEGWHERYGEKHAEVNALEQVTEHHLLKHSTAYVTLEPCNHHGNTPPCSEALIAAGVQKVVIACADPDPRTAGQGIARLKNAGIEVQVGLLAAEARALNKRFFINQEQKRPFVVLKWAQTKDGFIARQDFSSKWISSELARTEVHKWRTEESAIMVGTRTAFLDNPQLTSRMHPGRNPVRILLDPDLRVPTSHHIYDQQAASIIINGQKDGTEGTVEFIKIAQNNSFIPTMLETLWQRNKISSVIVEGGAKTLQRFLEKHLWDEARVFIDEQTFENGIAAPVLDLGTSRAALFGSSKLYRVANPAHAFAI